MEALFSIIIILASILLILVVFIQNPKGGGLISDFGAAQQLGGVKKTNDFIEKTTWGLAAVVATLSIVMTIQMSTPVEKVSSDDKSNTTEQPTDGETGAIQNSTN